MKTVAYSLPNTIEVGETLQRLAFRIPCFISAYVEEEGSYHEEAEVVIECREADVAFVERTLAEFV